MPNGRPQSPMWFSRITSWPEELVQPDQRIADHGRTEVTDVHLLGDVRRRIVDDDGHRLGRRFDTEAVVGGDNASWASRNAAAERDVDEPGPGDFEILRDIGQDAGVDDLLCEFARVRSDSLRQEQARR